MGTNGHSETAADTLVIFGITGDLAKKMTFRALYRLEAGGKLECPIVGVAIDDWTVEQLREHGREAIASTVAEVDEEVMERLLKRIDYVQGDYGDGDTFKRVGEAMSGTDYQDLPAIPDAVASTLDMVASNAAHLAGLLRASCYPGVAA